MTETPYLHLPLTPRGDDSKLFLDFRTEVAGDDEGSALMLLDAAIEDLDDKVRDGVGGDMLSDDYDLNDIVKNAGGIAPYIQAVSSSKPTVATLTLPATNWIGNGPYLQSVSIDGVIITTKTKVDAQTDYVTLQQLSDDGTTALYIVNSSGALVAYALTAVPQSNLTIQVTTKETNYEGLSIVGKAITIGASNTIKSISADVEDNMLVLDGASIQLGEIVLDGRGVSVEDGRITFSDGDDAVLDSIYISTPPNKTEYQYGESFDATGMVVKARYTIDGDIVADREISNYAYSSVLTIGQTSVTIVYTEDGITKAAEQPVVVQGDSEVGYITFASSDGSEFGLYVYQGEFGWDGIIEYSTDLVTWNEWGDGHQELESSNGELFLRGTGNTVITGDPNNAFLYEDVPVYPWTFRTNGAATIRCVGNIEMLLDYETALAGDHPSMGQGAFMSLFASATQLSSAPDLPSLVLSKNCYRRMFQNCTNLISPPELPATTLARQCYGEMFRGCTNLSTAPRLPATNLATYCYYGMFRECTSLTEASSLPATTLASGCYYSMFGECTNLAVAPELPATTLNHSCYRQMFYRCSSLTQAPSLAAAVMEDACYADMFAYCSSLTSPPALPATTLAYLCYFSMFQACINLIKLPYLPSVELERSCYWGMFSQCEKIKMSETIGTQYQNAYYIPPDNTPAGSLTLNAMFYRTGGTFKGTPSPNTTYYTSNEIVYA